MAAEPVEHEPSLERRIVRSSGWVAAGVGATQLLSLLTMLVLARLLDPRAFGLFALAATFLAVLDPLQESGLGAALVYRREDARAAAATAALYSPLLAIALGGATWVAAPSLAHAFGSASLADVLRAVTPIILLRGLAVVPTALLERELDFRARAKADIAGALCQCGVALGLAFAGAGVWSLVGGLVAAATAQTATLWTLVPRRPSPREARLRLLRELVGYGRFVGAANVVNLVNRTLDNLVVGRLVGPAGLGLYSVAFRVASTPANVLAQILGRAMFPAYSLLRHDLPAFRRAYVQNVQRVVLVALPAGVGLAFAAEPIVRTVLGERWLGAVEPLRILAFFGLVKALTGTCGAVWLGRGRPQLDLGFQVAHVLLVAPVLVVATHLYGLVGAAAGMLVTDVVTGIPALLLTWRLLDLRATTVAAAVARPLACSFVLAACLGCLLPVGGALPSGAAVALLVTAGVVAYAAAAAVLARNVLMPIWSSLRPAKQ